MRQSKPSWRDDVKIGCFLILAGLCMGMTLHEAVESDDLEAVRRIVQSGGDVHAVNAAGHTPLHLAKSVPMAQWLVQAGAGLEARSNKGQTPLMLAAVVAPPEVVVWLIEAGADVRAVNPQSGLTVLHYLAWSERREALARRVIEAGAEVNARDRNLSTPLHRASANLITPLADVLLAHGADPDALDEEGATPLMLALMRFGIEEPHPEFLDLYFGSGFDPNAHGPTGLTALHLAAARDRMHGMVKRLAHAGANLEAEAELPGYGVTGFRPLHAAAWLGMAQSVTALLDQGADPDARSSDGRTALHWAASPLRDGLPQTVFLVRQLAGILDTFQPVMDTDQRPVRPRLRKNGLPAVKTLMARGADLTARDASGRTPLERARDAGYPEMAAWLEHPPGG